MGRMVGLLAATIILAGCGQGGSAKRGLKVGQSFTGDEYDVEKVMLISDETDFHAHAELQAANATELQLMRHETEMMGHKIDGKPYFGNTTIESNSKCRVLELLPDGVKVLVEEGLYEGIKGWITWATLEKTKPKATDKKPA